MTTLATRSLPVSGPAPEPVRPFGERFRGIDGLRAIAVVLVMLFHLLPGKTVGGYIGVDLFFVISGFLITGLLLREKARTGGVNLGRFWLRRARRLLPALAVVLLVCSSIALVFGGDVLVGLPRQLLGATTFSYNWLDIAGGTQYFNDATPELFRNLWSLAVEEQFYLVWPLAVLAIALIRKPRVRVAIALAVAALSLAAMITLFATTGDSTRVYYGTDTHSFGLAIGAALALFVDARPPSTWRRGARRVLLPAGVLSLAAIVWLAIVLREDDALVYRGGLALVAVLTAIAIAACIVPNGVLGRALDLEPVRWVGVRSFGLYLWHWPLFVLFAVALPQFTTDNDGLQLLGGAAACLTAVAAALSYRFVEQPIRRGGFRAPIRAWWRHASTGRAAAWRAVAASVVLFAAVTMTGLALVVAPTEGSVQASIEAGQQAAQNAPPVIPAPIAPQQGSDPAEPVTPGQPVDPGPVTVPGQVSDPGQVTDPAQTAPQPGTLLTMPTGDQITAIGDSVMLAVTPELQKAYPGIDIHAVVSRQMSKAPGIVKKIADGGKLRPVLLIGLGTNGPIEQHDLDHILSLAGPQTQVVLVNVQAPRGWTKGNNKVLSEFAAAHRNVELADWHRDIHGHLNYLYDDKIHAKNSKGGVVYARSVTDAFGRLIAPPVIVDMNLLRRPPTP